VSITISLLNMKGGVGKTTLAVNLAWHFYEIEKAKVLLIDLDPQFNSTQYLMSFKAFQTHRGKFGTITNLLQNPTQLTLGKSKKKQPFSTTLHNVQKTKFTRFDLLPADLSLAWVVKNPGQMEQRLEMLLKKHIADYDYIFIDCAPTDTVLTTMALTASDFLLTPMRPDRYSILGFGNLVETVQTFKDTCNDPHSVRLLGVVFTQMFGTEIERQAILDIEQETIKAGAYVFSSSLHYSQSFARALAERSPIFATRNAHSKPKQSIGKIADEMKKQIVALQAKTTTLKEVKKKA